jgi:hypothetical protein
MLKQITTFEIRSGVKPKFDKGDLVTNDKEILLIRDITSTQDDAYYIYNSKESGGIKEYRLLKSPNIKFLLYISNGGIFDIYDFNVFEIANGKCDYPIWFEKEYNSYLKSHKKFAKNPMNLGKESDIKFI